ncbi:MAG TPA: YbaK/EbsC family protein, partial [Thermomicrobiales bacterium]|nr:YbaK/EbsC family protein [Thermomicrobiales bacterium]
MAVEPPAQLRDLIAAERLAAEFFTPGVPMHTVAEAAAALGAPERSILKTLLFADGDGRHLVAIAAGPERVDRARLAAVAGRRSLKMADAATVLRLTGYPAGGVAPIGHATPLPTFIDKRVAELDEGYGGGGHPELLLRLRIADIIRLTNATIASFV